MQIVDVFVHKSLKKETIPKWKRKLDNRGRILRCNWERSLKSLFPYLLLTVTSTNGLYIPPPLEKSGLKLVCKILPRNLNEIERSRIRLLCRLSKEN